MCPRASGIGEEWKLPDQHDRDCYYRKGGGQPIDPPHIARRRVGRVDDQKVTTSWHRPHDVLPGVIERATDLDNALYKRIVGDRNTRPDSRTEIELCNQLTVTAPQFKQDCQSLRPQLNCLAVPVKQPRPIQIERAPVQPQAGHEHTLCYSS
jgi:hypothetical protein